MNNIFKEINDLFEKIVVSEENYSQCFFELKKLAKVIEARSKEAKKIVEETIENGFECDAYNGYTIIQSEVGRVGYNDEEGGRLKLLDFLANEGLEIYLEPDISNFVKNETNLENLKYDSDNNIYFWKGKPMPFLGKNFYKTTKEKKV